MNDETYCLLRPRSRKLGQAHPFTYTLALAREHPNWPVVTLSQAQAQVQVNAEQSRLRYAEKQVADGQALKAAVVASMNETESDAQIEIDNPNEMTEEQVQQLMADTNQAVADQAGAPAPPQGYGDTDKAENLIDLTKLSEQDLRAYHVNHFGVPLPADVKTKVQMMNFIRQSEAEKREDEAELAAE